MNVEGSCHCGQITFEAEIDPEAVRVCHCTDCQTLTGSAYRVTVQAAASSFVLRSGAPKTYIKTADSGATSHQLFCPQCASPLYSTSVGAGPRTVNLRLGTARQRAELRPRAQYWCRSAQEWATVHETSRRFETQ